MRIYLMTDLEGVCGVLNHPDWCSPSGSYYARAKELLTREVNAAVEGMFEGGASEIDVADGHGPGGVEPSLLDPRVRWYMRGWPERWPLLVDKEPYDAVCWVGQHAKASTPYAHICHTQSFAYRDDSFNGVSVGEFGQFALCAGEFGVRAIFCSGDEAMASEAEALAPGIETVSVKRGINPDPGYYLPAGAVAEHHAAARHLHPEEARGRIREGARRAVERAAKEDFGLVTLNPPYERVTVLRSDETNPPRVSRTAHPDSFVALMNTPFAYRPIKRADPLEALDSRE